MIRQATLLDFLYVAHNQRDIGKVMLEADGIDRDIPPDEFAILRMKRSTVHYTLLNETTGRPVCVFGAIIHGGVAHAWLVATDELERLGKSMTWELVSFARRLVRTTLDVKAAHRIEADIICGLPITEACRRFARKIGLDMEEFVKHRAGANGEDKINLAAWR